MPPEHVPAAGAHPADALVVASADHPLGGQAEDDRRHPVLMSCGDREETRPGKPVSVGGNWSSPSPPCQPADSQAGQAHPRESVL